MKTTKELTRGAMAAAIYGVLLLLNQQTALYIESTMSWIFVFPILVYTAMYGTKPGLLVAAAMALLSFLFGSFTTWFYSWTSIAMGYVYGLGVYKKWPSNRRLVLLFLFSVAANTLIMTLWAKIFGYDYAEDLALLDAYLPWLSFSAYLAILIIFTSILETICIHLLAILLCQRLKIPAPRMQKITSLRPSRAVGVASVLIWISAVFIFHSSVVKYWISLENIVFILLFLDAILLIYYGVLWFYQLAILKQKRWLAALAVLGAFLPGINIIWLVIGEADALFQIRSKIQGNER